MTPDARIALRFTSLLIARWAALRVNFLGASRAPSRHAHGCFPLTPAARFDIVRFAMKPLLRFIFHRGLLPPIY